MTRDLMSRYLESFRQVENASLGRVSKYGIIAGVSHAELFDGGRKVQFRPGAADVINHFLRVPNCHVCVVSANWSADFIRGALEANGVSGQTSVAIHCNDLDFSSNTGLSLATVRPRLVVASDKVARVAGYKNELTHKYGSDIALVYAGDSLTDLPALLLADVGLCVCQGSDVVKWCKLLDIEFDKPRFDENNKAIYRLSDWRSAIDIVESHFK
ncbi:hypothetical protein IWW50_003298 [Coemansia erecta]|nr:hypothetical protein IWW50_003298 [Coemansia erecta]